MGTILLGVLIVLLLILLIALFGTFTFRLFLSYDKGFRGKVYLKWISSFFISLEYDTGEELVSGRILGKRFGAKEDRGEAEEDSEYQFSEPDTEKESAPVEDYIPERPQEDYVPDTGDKIETKDEPIEKKEKKAKKRDGAQKKDNLIFMIRNKRWRDKILNWLKRVMRSLLRLIKFERLKVYGKAGFCDPVLTGKMFGYLVAVKSAMALEKRSYQINIEPVFMKDHIEFESEVGFKSSLWRVCVPLLTATFLFPYISTYRLWKKAGKKDLKS
ncbi:hypothetical protein CHISP_0217 [Chitinispirillum alkaliphilum]|nr:hypothetical protein CHISP_0217 [Chitinispirillum alkaliphilum]